jgi:ribosomal-protein-alanine N-acetyltransferase
MRRPGPEARILAGGVLDAPVSAALQNDAFPEQPWSGEDVATLVRGPGSLALLAAGRAYGEVMPLGYVLARVAGGEAEILSLAVTGEAWRQGLGRRLLAETMSAAAGRGARRIHLDVATDNAAAIALYSAAGFETAGRRPGYYTSGPGPAKDALLLARDLPAGTAGERHDQNPST